MRNAETEKLDLTVQFRERMPFHAYVLTRRGLAVFAGATLILYFVFFHHFWLSVGLSALLSFFIYSKTAPTKDKQEEATLYIHASKLIRKLAEVFE